ncbi:hypothetical protein ACIQUO_28445 [Streptomyces albogriseolus]|uniref:hypothetical protein n=1 Tax=Streptomyces albogriseolus TaxID=1887 RepID=UPI002253AF12|nr:hypothetical protein [Streptomyces viridodiastaticus]MCX4567442.1 hypothetical protein [Streptomyces viridodiastaticus]MCX4620688.1 hypothetical protein [Streptomyces viridodiastaticus]
MPSEDELARRRYDKLETLMRAPATRLVDGRLFVLDQREVPEEIERLAGDAAPEAVDQARKEALRPRLT